MSSSRYMTADDVLTYVNGKAAGGDLAFEGMLPTPAEIQAAMEAGAREWNDVPPYVSMLNAGCLPMDSNMLLDAVALHLMLQEKQKLTRADIDYTAGGVTTNLVAKRIEHLDTQIKAYSERFKAAASSRKIARNLSRAYGSVG